VKLQFALASHKVHICINIAKQSRQIRCRSATSQNRNAAAPERFQVMMAIAVRHEFLPKARQISRDMLEIRNANG
jgi:hypothetical protein